MNKPLVIIMMVVIACFLVFGFAISQEETGKTGTDTTKKVAVQEDTTKKEVAKKDTTKKEAAEKDTTAVVYKYVGNTKCKMCHNSSKTGMIYDIWSKTKHATAFATLANEESKKTAKEMKISDPQKDAKCLVCHVVGYGQPTDKDYSMEEGVGCEACHGPGEQYWKTHAKKKEEAAKTGFIAKPDKELCAKCHNEKSPTYQELDFKVAYKVIEHHMIKVEKK